MAARQVDVQVAQLSLKDSNLPPEIRINFVKKVYGILAAMLAVSFAIASPFVRSPRSTIQFMDANPWIVGLAMVVILIHQLVNLAMAFERCCGGGACMRTYLKMFVTVPWNYVFLFTYASAFGVGLGFICSSYQAESVVLAFVLTASIMVALTIYAVYTKTDFTGMGMYIFAFMCGLLLLGIVGIFMPHNPFIHKAMAVGGAVLCSFVTIYDTQLIFGTAAVDFGGRSVTRRIEFTVDMYAFAAYQLYLDFVNMFLYLLELFGRRRD